MLLLPSTPRAGCAGTTGNRGLSHSTGNGVWQRMSCYRGRMLASQTSFKMPHSGGCDSGQSGRGKLAVTLGRRAARGGLSAEARKPQLGRGKLAAM